MLMTVYMYQLQAMHASCKSALTGFKEKKQNLCGDEKPLRQWRKVVLKRTGEICQSVTQSGKVVQ